MPEDDRALAARGVEDRADVVGPLLEARDVRDPVGQPRASLVESDEPGERQEALPLPERVRCVEVVVQIQVGDRARGEHQVDVGLAAHLVRDVDVPALRIARPRVLHPSSCSSTPHDRKVGAIRCGIVTLVMG